jgi:hypothetical protein
LVWSGIAHGKEVKASAGILEVTAGREAARRDLIMIWPRRAKNRANLGCFDEKLAAWAVIK